MSKHREIAEAAERVDEARCRLDDLTRRRVALDAEASDAHAEWQSAVYQLNNLMEPLTAAAIAASARREKAS